MTIMNINNFFIGSQYLSIVHNNRSRVAFPVSEVSVATGRASAISADRYPHQTGSFVNQSRNIPAPDRHLHRASPHVVGRHHAPEPMMGYVPPNVRGYGARSRPNAAQAEPAQTAVTDFPDSRTTRMQRFAAMRAVGRDDPSNGVSTRISVTRSIWLSFMSGETLSMIGRYWFCPRRKSNSGSRIESIRSRL